MATPAKNARWTDKDVKLLLDTVAKHDTAKAGIAAVADKLGKSHGTVQQKYYALKRGTGSKRSKSTATKTKRFDMRPYRREGLKDLYRAKGLEGFDQLAQTLKLIRGDIATLEAEELERERFDKYKADRGAAMKSLKGLKFPDEAVIAAMKVWDKANPNPLLAKPKAQNKALTKARAARKGK